MGEMAVGLGDWGLAPRQLPLLNSRPFPPLPLGLPPGKGSCHIQHRVPTYLSAASFASLGVSPLCCFSRSVAVGPLARAQ